MLPEEWDQIKTLFGAAINLRPEERIAFLEAACSGNKAVLETVLDLLENHAENPDTAGSRPAAAILKPLFAEGALIAERFRVIRLLGSGGMGEVYEVWDERLRLTLAAKTLRRELVRDGDALRRFRREVLLARNVTHDNVCRVYDLVEHPMPEDSNGSGYHLPVLTMEFLSGETLASLLTKSRPLPIEQAHQIANGTAAGLQVLHDSGIIHRDLKPLNIMLTRRRDGTLRPVVMDFGLARSGNPENDLFETRLALQAGSPYYMAPELLQDAAPGIASDIYAFGLVLDDMVTAERAFTAQSLPAMIFAKLCEDPLPPSRRAGAPLDPAWDAAILACIDRDASRRPASVAEVIEILDGRRIIHAVPDPAPATPRRLIPQRWRRSAVTAATVLTLVIGTVTASFAIKPAVTTIAVFDIENQTDKQFEYLTRGTTSELIRRLAELQSVRVLPQYTTRRSVDPARLQQIRFSLEGSLQSYNNQIQLFVVVTDNEKGETAWTQRFDGTVQDNPLRAQEEIARESTAAVRRRMLFSGDSGWQFAALRDRVGQLFSVPWQHASSAPTRSPVAFDRYLRARHLIAEVTPRSTRDGIELLESAVAEDSEFALAWATLATAYIGLTDFHDEKQADLMAKAQHAAGQAVRADRNLPEAWMAYAATREIALDWSAAETSYRHALELKPTFASARRWYANMMVALGRFDEAIQAAKKAAEDDPYDPVSGPTGYGWMLFISGKETEAARVLSDACQGREAVGARLNLAQVYASLAQRSSGAQRQEYLSKALTEAQTVATVESRSHQLSHGNAPAKVSDQMYALVYSLAGDFRSAAPYVMRLEAAMREGTISPAILGWVYAIQGRQDDAVTVMKMAAHTPDRKVLYARVMPYLQTLRSRPDYQALLASMRL